MDELPFITLLPAKYQALALVLVALSPYLTRGYHALSTGKGLRGMLSAIWLGTNTPKTEDRGQRAEDGDRSPASLPVAGRESAPLTALNRSTDTER